MVDENIESGLAFLLFTVRFSSRETFVSNWELIESVRESERERFKSLLVISERVVSQSRAIGRRGLEADIAILAGAFFLRL